MKLIDLHVHSNKSDGTIPPSELVCLAAQCGLSAFALTDHDNTDGLSDALEAGLRHHIEVIPGIEFSTEYLGHDVHIVGLDVDWLNPAFQERLEFYRAERDRRNQKVIDLMAADGIDISSEKMKASFPGTVWTRAHFARYLTDHGYVSEMWEAFRTLLDDGCRYHVPRKKVSPMEAVRLIRRFHGIPVLAHPFQYRLSDTELHALLLELKEAGLIAMEVYYSTYNEAQSAQLQALADKYDLLPGGGSDFHGSNKPDIALGTGKQNLQIPYELLENLRKKRKEDE